MASLTDQKPDPRIGTRFGESGRYEIRRRIGRGGMADVYKAADTQLPDKVFAVKILTVEADAGLSESRQREIAKLRSLFLEEARALSRVRDSNVVTIFSNGHLADGTPYMLMEYLAGTDLHRLLKTLASKDELMPIDRAVEIILGVAAGVQACHLGGVIHRDLKPANIFLEMTAKGEVVKVLDFSVAKVAVSRDQTMTDFVIGTEDYMAPEQRDRKPATERSDQYSIGALLYKCLTGEAPRGLFARLREKRPDVPELLEAAIFRAMDQDPARRFASVHVLGQAIHPFATPEARARWKHYYTTPPLPIAPALTGPIVPPPAHRFPLAVGTRVSAYDFRDHERSTAISDDDPSTATTLDRPTNLTPSVVEVPSLASAPPTKETVRPARLDARAEFDSDAAQPATTPSDARAGEGEGDDDFQVPGPRTRRRVQIGIGLFVSGAVIWLAAFSPWRFGRPNHEPGTAPAWMRDAVPGASAPVLSASPAPAPVVLPSSPSVVSQPAPPPLAPTMPTPRPAPPAPPATVAAAGGGTSAARTVSAEAAAPTPSPRPARRKRPPKIQYDADGFPLLH
jgi:serine/threonine protein kinase